MSIKFVATCLTAQQKEACISLGIEVSCRYAHSYGEIVHGCVTDFSVHCFNSASLAALADLGVRRATLHPELNLAQIRDIEKCIDTEVVIYGKLPLMKIGNPGDFVAEAKQKDASAIQKEAGTKQKSKPKAATKVQQALGSVLIDRTGISFFVKDGMLYNSVPIFMADKLKDVEKSGITHGRFIFTTESDSEVRMVIKAYMYKKMQKIKFTRGKFYFKV